jgi:tRNA threonylcarbamoyladenosine biosynthesis protein TsaB
MRILAIDTSGPECAAGVFDSSSDRLLAFRSETIGKGHAELLSGMVDAAVAEAGMALADLDRIAVVIGPGSFTGIRVGVALARGLALALKIPAIGVSTLQVVAEPYLATTTAPVMAAIDARRDALYVQLFAGDGSALSEPAELSYDDARDLTERRGATAVGSGALILDGAASPQIDKIPLDVIGRMGVRLPATIKAQPLYIRGADAKPQQGYAVKHA